MKGSSPAGTTTQTQVNPTQQMQLPFLQGGWNSALNLFDTQPLQYYPQQTLAQNPLLEQGYTDVYNTGQGLNAMLPAYNTAYNTMLAGGNTSPADPYYQQYASGQTPQQQYYNSVADAATSGGAGFAGDIANYANQAAANNNIGLTSLGQTAQGQGVGMQELAKAASGYYVNKNPYIDQMYAQAAAPLGEDYQRRIAPGINSAFSGAGRYGSGAAAQAASTGQQNYLDSLAGLSSSIYGQNYARERQAQDAAATQYSQLGNQAGQAYGQLYNQGLGMGITGNTAAAAVYDQALRMGMSATQASQLAQQYGVAGLQNSFNTSQQAQQNALRLFPQYAAAQMAGPNATLQAGQGLTQLTQQAIDDQMKRFYGVQNAPYETLSKYLANIGQPTTGSSQTTNPYFQNPMASMLGGALGLTGIGSNLGLFGSGGLGGLGGAAPGWAAGSGMGAPIFTNLATGATSDIAGISMPGIASGIGSALSKI